MPFNWFNIQLARLAFPNKDLEYNKKLQQKLLDNIPKNLSQHLTKIIYEYISCTNVERVIWSHLMDVMAIELAESSVPEPEIIDVFPAQAPNANQWTTVNWK